MKIIQLCAIDQTISTLLKELIRQLMEEDYEVVCVCSKGPFTDGLRQEGFTIINVPIKRKIRLISMLKSIFGLYKLFKKETPHIVHAHTPMASILGRIAGKLAGVPIVLYTAHGFYFHENMPSIKYKIYLNVEKYLAKYFTDFIFTQSEEDKNTAIQNKFIEEHQILNIGNGVDVLEKFNPSKIDEKKINRLYEELNISRSDIVITFIGRLVEEKGILDLLEAFSKIKDEKVKLLVVGDIDQGSRDIETKSKAVDQYKEKKNILFTGFRNDINHILYITDIFCLPSYREGMPRSIIEAMAMECAVIATRIRGCREEVIHGKTGFLVNTNSPEEIGNKVRQLIEDEDLLYQMKIEGRKRALEQFNEMKCIKKQIEVIKRLDSYGS